MQTWACASFCCFSAEIGPVTITTDPKKFQFELRELYVQVGSESTFIKPAGNGSSVLRSKVIGYEIYGEARLSFISQSAIDYKRHSF